MTRIHAERLTARIDGEVVVFLIGMRINRFRKIHRWLPVARATGAVPASGRLESARDRMRDVRDDGAEHAQTGRA